MVSESVHDENSTVKKHVQTFTEDWTLRSIKIVDIGFIFSAYFFNFDVALDFYFIYLLKF